MGLRSIGLPCLVISTVFLFDLILIHCLLIVVGEFLLPLSYDRLCEAVKSLEHRPHPEQEGTRLP